MIYVLESTYYNKKTGEVTDLIKIGYTDNFKKRWKSYKLHSPLCEVLYTIDECTKKDEKALHSHFNKYLYPDYGNEWFVWDQEIIDFFETHKTKESLQEFSIEKDYKKLSKYKKLLYWWELEKSTLSSGILDFLKFYKKNQSFPDRLKYFCISKLLTDEDREVLFDHLPECYKTYYQTLGPTRCKANGYNKTDLDKEINILTFDTKDIKRELDYVFKEGEVYLLSDIKNTLRKIYETLGFKKTPKATDLSEYYEISRKRVNQKEAFKIIKKL